LPDFFNFEEASKVSLVFKGNVNTPHPSQVLDMPPPPAPAAGRQAIRDRKPILPAGLPGPLQGSLQQQVEEILAKGEECEDLLAAQAKAGFCKSCLLL
jgi:hypothetical protein